MKMQATPAFPASWSKVRLKYAVSTVQMMYEASIPLTEMSQSVRRPAAQRTQGSEKESQGKVFVAYMRRYAGVLQTFLTELEIKFARVRDIIGPNVDQSGTFTQKFTDYPADAMAARTQAAEKLL